MACCFIRYPHGHVFCHISSCCNTFVGSHHLIHHLQLRLVGCSAGVLEVHLVQLDGLFKPELGAVKPRLGCAGIFIHLHYAAASVHHMVSHHRVHHGLVHRVISHHTMHHGLVSC